MSIAMFPRRRFLALGAWCLLPWRVRALSVPLCLPLLMAPVRRPAPGRFELLAADVGQGSAVLIRAVEPLTGLDLMRARRTRARRDVDLTSGPGKLCQALALDLGSNGVDLVSSRQLWLGDDDTPPPLLGEHTEEVLRGLLGKSDADIAALRGKSVI